MALTCLTSAAQDFVLTAGATGEVFHVKPTPGSYYYWSISGCGTVTSNNGSDSVVTNWCTTPGLYTLKVVERSAKGCLGDTVYATVLITAKVPMSVLAPTDICQNEVVMLQASGATRYHWSTGDTSRAIYVHPGKTSNYFVVGYRPNFLPDTSRFTIRVHPRPRFDISHEPLDIHTDDRVIFRFSGTGVDKWQWIFEDTSRFISALESPEYSFRTKGEKKVTFVARNNAGCVDSIEYRFIVTTKTYVFIPTGFSPNDDGLNDVFEPIGSQIERYNMRVFNRWGETIFENHDQSIGWDGKYAGQLVPEGVYTYSIELKGKDGFMQYLSGSVTVIR